MPERPAGPAHRGQADRVAERAVVGQVLGGGLRLARPPALAPAPSAPARARARWPPGSRRPPQLHTGPSAGSTTTWPIWPALPDAPSISRPSRIRPPPTPVETTMPSTLRTPRPAPRQCSPMAMHDRVVMHPHRDAREAFPQPARSGKDRQAGMFSGDTTPSGHSIGPPQPQPTPASPAGPPTLALSRTRVSSASRVRHRCSASTSRGVGTCAQLTSRPAAAPPPRRRAWCRRCRSLAPGPRGSCPASQDADHAPTEHIVSNSAAIQPAAIQPAPHVGSPAADQRRPVGRTLAELRASGHQYLTVKQEIRRNLLARMRAGEDAFPGIIGFGQTVLPAAGARHHRRARRHPARRARPGQDPADPHAHRPAGRVDAGRGGMRDQRSPVRAGVRALPPAGRRAGGGPARHLAAAQRPLRREAGHAGHQRGRPDRRHRPGQGGRGPDPRRPRDDPLRPGAADQPGHLLPERAARPGRADPGRAAQRAGGAGHRRPRLRAAAAAGPGARGQRQPGGLHQPGPDHHPPQGPVRRRDPHPLPALARCRAGADPPGGPDRLGRPRSQAPCCPST